MTGPRESERMRLFVAIELPDTWKQALAELQDEMRRAIAADASVAGVRVRWVKPEGIHLTLKFLGQVESERLEKIHWALSSAIPTAPGFEVKLGWVGSFSDRHAPSVIWAGLHFEATGTKLPAVYELAESIETWLGAAGFPRERRAFAPHLTLARLPQDLDADMRVRIATITTAVAAPQVDPFAVQQVSLMRSHLGRDGARYERLASFPA